MLKLNTILLNSIVRSVDAFDFMDDLFEALKNYCKLLNTNAKHNEIVFSYLRLIFNNFCVTESVIRRHMINVILLFFIIKKLTIF